MSDDFTGADFAPSADSGGGASSVATVEATAQPGAATTEPAVSATTTATPDPARPAGPIPFDVHKTALDNARTKATAEWDQQYGWAKTYDRERVETLNQFWEALQADPVATFGNEFKTLANHPVYGPQLRSFLGQQLAAGRQPAPLQPQQVAEQALPVIQFEDGRSIDLNAFREQILEAAQERFRPAMDAAKELQQAKEFAVAQRDANTFATGLLPELNALPQFKEHAAEIKAALATTKLQTDHPAEVSAAVYRIYNRIVLPKLQTAERQSVLHDLNHKAAASTVNPANAGTRAPKSVDEMSIAEALQHYANQQSA